MSRRAATHRKRRRKPAARPGATRDVIRSLAVLPFENVSRDPAQEYFADGMTEALISELARIKALRVISRTSAMKYKGVQKSLPEIARELNVDAILEGSALLVGKRVRVTRAARLGARADETLWADRYDGEIEDVLDLQSRSPRPWPREIAIQVTPRRGDAPREAAPREPRGARRVPEGPPHRRPPPRRRRSSWPCATSSARWSSIRTTRPAWAGLADCHTMRGRPGDGAARRGERGGRASGHEGAGARRFAGARRTRRSGSVALHERGLHGGRPLLQRAMELNPGLHARATHSLGAHLLLLRATPRGAGGDAQGAQPRPAVDADPHVRRRRLLLRARVRALRSSTTARRSSSTPASTARTPTSPARSRRSGSSTRRAAVRGGTELSGGVAGPSFGLAHLEASSGDEAEARRILEDLTAARSHRVVSAWGIAALHASLGDVDEAFRWLDTAVEERPRDSSSCASTPGSTRSAGIRDISPWSDRVGLDTL